jgi:hypothetical protein
MDGSYQGTGFYEVRPLAPGVTYGKELFLKPLGDAMKLWKRMNEGAAPAGVTLPLVLGDGTDQGAFASLLSALCFAYAGLEDLEVDLRIARGNRNVTQTRAFAAMKMYREGAENKFVLHPELIETLPRLTEFRRRKVQLKATAMIKPPTPNASAACIVRLRSRAANCDAMSWPSMTNCTTPRRALRSCRWSGMNTSSNGASAVDLTDADLDW